MSTAPGPGPGRHDGPERGPGIVSLPADRLPPHNLAAERGAIGGAILDATVLPDLVLTLRPEDFYRGIHQEIWRAILALYDRGEPVDAVTVWEEISRHGEDAGGDGATDLAEILRDVTHPFHARHYAEIVRQKAILREVIAAANETLAAAYSNLHTSDDVLALAETRLLAIAAGRALSDVSLLGDAAATAIARMHHRRDQGGRLAGLPFGLAQLDDMTDGLHPGQLVILAARPSIGKTALALNIIAHLLFGMDPARRPLMVSLEMEAEDLGERMLCLRSGVAGHKIRTGRGLTQDDLIAADQALTSIRSRPMWLDDTPVRTVHQIASVARRQKARHGLDLLVVDYLQLVDPGTPPRGVRVETREGQVARMSRSFKSLARELKVPVLLLCQLNRKVEERQDHSPRMSDLRESGAIEQDADVVLLMHRPEFYDPNDRPGQAELLLAKHRAGETGTVKLDFVKELMRFGDFDPTAGPAALAGPGQPF